MKTHWLIGKAEEAFKWREEGGAIASAQRRQQRMARGYRKVKGPLTAPGKFRGIFADLQPSQVPSAKSSLLPSIVTPTTAVVRRIPGADQEGDLQLGPIDHDQLGEAQASPSLGAQHLQAASASV